MLTKLIILMQRDNYIDAVCGLLIIWMIIGHAIGNYELKDSLMYIVGNHLFPFFMPYFFIRLEILICLLRS